MTSSWYDPIEVERTELVGVHGALQSSKHDKAEVELKSQSVVVHREQSKVHRLIEVPSHLL